MSIYRLAALSSLGILSLVPGLAQGCSCTQQPELEYFCAAKQVVVADIVAAERRLTVDTGIQAADFYPQTVWQIHFRTAEVLKGEPLLYGLAITSGLEAECGLLLRPGSRALIFLDKRGAVHACNGSIADLQTSKESQATLGKLRQLASVSSAALLQRCAANPSR